MSQTKYYLNNLTKFFSPKGNIGHSVQCTYAAATERSQVRRRTKWRLFRAIKVVEPPFVLFLTKFKSST